ncbi:hypothetical protein A3860_29085 [Niastella vici]|uniref:Lipoprotein n=1 Tax=Niastella vici TaxID=1703345 RepID=A0A1V9FVQ3_9BACT|nr:hypothetical protein [Niastella vici]OQP62414.1 hypothetical protein A3860_29085 [Niastella vici]
MKRVLPVLLLAAVFFGCGQQKKDPVAAPKAKHATNNAPLFHYGNPVLLQYDRYLAGLDTQLIDMGSQAVDTFQLLFKKQPAAVCDTAFYIFNQYHQRLSSWAYGHMDTTIIYEDIVYPEKTKPLSKKQLARKKQLDKNGFYLFGDEGSAYIEQDQHFLSQHFGLYVSAPLKQYLVQLAKEQKEGFSEDAGITIEANVLAERTVWWENFNKTIANTNFLYTKEAVDKYNLLLWVLMTGMENTPVNDEYANDDDSIPNKYKLYDYFQKAWTYVQEKHPQSGTNAIVTPYLNAWLKKDSAEINQVFSQFQKEHKSPWGE